MVVKQGEQASGVRRRARRMDLLVIWRIWQEFRPKTVLIAKRTPAVTARSRPGITLVNRFISPITLCLGTAPGNAETRAKAAAEKGVCRIGSRFTPRWRLQSRFPPLRAV